MKKNILFAALVIAFGAQAQGLKTPAPSPSQTIKTDFALSSIEVNYSRPNVKGRKIFGDLVPFGKMWRTGANGATKLTFGEDVKVGGVAVKAGSYALYTIPNTTEWEVVINKGANNGGLAGYKAEEDVAKFKVKPRTLATKAETFNISLENQTSNAVEIVVSWDNTAIAIPVESEIDSKIMKNIETVMGVDGRPYFQAAQYYFDNGKDLPKALEWVSKAVDQNPTAYWVMHLKAKIQAKMGDKAGAIGTANKSIELAKTGNNPDYVALNEKLIASLK